MATEYEDSSSTPEKLALLVFIAAIVIGNVSLDLNRIIFYLFKYNFRFVYLSRISYVLMENIGQICLY